MECFGKAFACVRGLYLVIGEGLNLFGFFGNMGDISGAGS